MFSQSQRAGAARQGEGRVSRKMRSELSALTSRFERYKKLAKNCLTGVGKSRPTTARATSRRSCARSRTQEWHRNCSTRGQGRNPRQAEAECPSAGGVLIAKVHPRSGIGVTIFVPDREGRKTDPFELVNEGLPHKRWCDTVVEFDLTELARYVREYEG